jgi:glycerate 2-kinase
MRYDSLAARAQEIFRAGLAAADPYGAVMRHAEHVLRVYRDGNFAQILLIAFGKAACPMAEAVLALRDLVVQRGIVITKYGHRRLCDIFVNVRVFEAGHPVPDETGVAATKEALALVNAADARTLVLCLVSGGGSALLVAPAEGITLDEKQEVTRLLLAGGATIGEMNSVRKHLSLVKGGRLAQAAAPARVLSLILSDVIGDPLDVIASGPTSPDPTTYADALAVLDHRGVMARLPASVRSLLRRGAEGASSETPKPGNPLFDRVENVIVGSNRLAVAAAARKAAELGFETTVISSEVEGEARDVGAALARKARDIQAAMTIEDRPVCLIQGGETTVMVTGSGKGGRNTELALAFAMEIQGTEGVCLLSAGTDGTDGPTDAAGAIADGETVARARAADVDPSACLANNDSYTFFEKTGGLLVTGPTGTNVMDLQIVLIGAAKRPTTTQG